jgi:hypothetical protein
LCGTTKIKKVGRVTSGERDEKLSVCAMGVSGVCVPPVMFAHKRIREELLAGGAPETITVCFQLVLCS